MRGARDTGNKKSSPVTTRVLGRKSALYESEPNYRAAADFAAPPQPQPKHCPRRRFGTIPDLLDMTTGNVHDITVLKRTNLSRFSRKGTIFVLDVLCCRTPKMLERMQQTRDGPQIRFL